MNILKQSTAATIKLGPFIDDTDGKTAETGLTIAQADIRLSKNGGDFAQTNNTAGATHDENGYYDIPLNATDTGTLGRLRVSVSKSGALPVWQDFQVVTANVYDTLCSTDSLDVNVASLSTDAITAASLKTDAITEIQNGLATAAALSVVDDFVDELESRLTASRAGYLDKLNVAGDLANTSNANSFKADVSGLATASALAAVDDLVDELESRLTAIRAGYLDKLNVSGILANTDNANLFKADVSGLATAAALATVNSYVDELESRLTAARATYLDKLNVAGTLANTDNADIFKADISNLATASALSTVITLVDELETRLTAVRAGYLDKLNITGTLANTSNADMFKADVSNLDATVSSRLATSDYTAPDNAGITAIQAKTDNLPDTPANEATLTAIKGAGWTDETLVALMTAIENISAGSGASAQEVWEYATRTLTGLPALPTDWITAASLKADAVTEIQSGLATAAGLSTISGLVDDLESRLTAARAGYLDKLNVAGELANTSNANLFKADTASVPQNIWSYHTRLLTNIGSTVESPTAGDPLNIYRDTTVLISLTNLGAIGVDDKLWFTVKDSVEEPDENSIIQIDRLGLLYINGAPASQVEDGSITVLDDVLGNVEIKLAQRQAALLPLYEAYPAQWDIKILHSGIVSILNIGTLYIKGTPTRAIL